MLFYSPICVANSRHFATAANVSSRTWTYPANVLSPAVAFLLHSNGIDPKKVIGTGKAGRILKYDVIRAMKDSQFKTTNPILKTLTDFNEKTVTGQQKTQNRRTFIDNLLNKDKLQRASSFVNAKKHAAHAHCSTEVCLSDIVALQSNHSAPSIDAILLRSIAIALNRYPSVNVGLQNGNKQYSSNPSVNITLIPSNQRREITIKDAFRKSSFLIEQEISAVDAVPTVLSDEQRSFAVLLNFPAGPATEIILSPNAALLTTSTFKKTGIKNEMPVSLPFVHLTLTYDACAFDAAVAAEFMHTIKESLESPLSLGS